MLLVLIGIGACQSAPPVLPTLAVLPSLTPTQTHTLAPIAAALPSESPAPPTLEPSTQTPPDTPTVTPSDAPTNAPAPTFTETPTVTWTPPPTLTDTPPPTVTRTPSLTITNTNTRPPTSTFTATVELSGMGSLGELAGRTTLLPPEQLYNPPTLTAFAVAQQTQVAGRSIIVALPTQGAPGTFGTPVVSGIATLAPAPLACALPPPAAISGLLAADPALQAQLGCPISLTPAPTASAAQVFERGMMVYVAGSPGTIYSLSNDGTFRRFNDTFAAGIDPESGGELPPPGLIEPVRGFGKVWRANPDVRAALGWALVPEAGDTASVLAFERGRAVYLPQRGLTVLLIDDFGGASGRWRSFGGSF